MGVRNKDKFVRETARAYYAARTRQERLQIRRMFCESLPEGEAGRLWELISLTRIDPDQIDPVVPTRKKSGKTVYLIQDNGQRRTFSSITEAASFLGIPLYRASKIANQNAKGTKFRDPEAPKLVFKVKSGRTNKPVTLRVNGESHKYDTLTDAARDTGYSVSALWSILNGRTKSNPIDIRYTGGSR